MKYLRVVLLLYIAGSSLVTEVAQAADEDAFLWQISPPLGQTLGHGQSALWTLPNVATQYLPLQPTPVMQAALQAQQEGRFLDALILLDEADKSGRVGSDAKDEMNLLRASFLLQGNQSQQALKILAPLLGSTKYAADAYALTVMAHLQQGQLQQAQVAAQHTQDFQAGLLPHLAMSYALQSTGRLQDARKAMHGFNTRTPQSAIALAREAELALTLDHVQSAQALVAQAQEMDAAHPYVIAISGLTLLIEGHAREAKAAFETALQRDPKDAKALLGLGLAEIRLGNFQAGQKKMQAANEADPGNALILTYLGRTQQQLGQTEAAKASWRSAQQADPKDPTPWLYQAQAELQANHPLEARDSLRQAQARTAYRSVYRGERLLREDEQLLQANLAEVQQKLGLSSLAFHTLSESSDEKNATNLRNQADILQGRRFGESARRSLLLQSQFDDRPGNLPATLDIYGDGAGQTGAGTPQHGAVSTLSAQQTSYNNYDELFGQRTMLEVDATIGSKNSNGEQIRLGVGSDTLGLGIAQRQFKTDGYTDFEGLDNSIWQGIVQWRPLESTQVFVSHQTFDSHRSETFYPSLPFGLHDIVTDDSRVTRLGLLHNLTEDGSSELRALWSKQQTDQTGDLEFIAFPFSFSQYGNSDAHSMELQYRRSGTTYATQWGVQQVRGQSTYRDASNVVFGDDALNAQQFYAAWQQTLNPYWQLDAGLGWGKIEDRNELDASLNTGLGRWLPKVGMVYTPNAATHLRFAAWRGMGGFDIGDASLAPASLAGFLLSRPGDNGKLVQATALGGDRQLSPAWLLAAETRRHKTDTPYIDTGSGQQALLWQQVDETSLALHWQPQERPWAVSLAHDQERVRNDPLGVTLDAVDAQQLRAQQLTLRWFANAQWTASLAWSHNHVSGTQNAYDLFFSPILLPYQSDFNQVDADMSWQFNGSRGMLTVGVRNATDKHFHYEDIDRLNPRFSNGRLVYSRLKLAW